ncbi:MAG TPA: hypothetical protein DCR17_16065, partial [Verrucomicrobiales bacterium]|nr:hypothetical protein [Verrucomicrobiales bacterium]
VIQGATGGPADSTVASVAAGVVSVVAAAVSVEGLHLGDLLSEAGVHLVAARSVVVGSVVAGSVVDTDHINPPHLLQ